MLLGVLIGVFVVTALVVTSFVAIAGDHKPTMISDPPVLQPVQPEPVHPEHVLVVPCGSVVPADDPAFFKKWLEDRE